MGQFSVEKSVSPGSALSGNQQRILKPARARRSPAGFILPSQPTLSPRAPAGNGWLHEIKHDGYRMLARVEGGRVTLWSRNATNFTLHPPRICEGLAALPVRSAVMDGEALVLRDDGHSDFHAMNGRGARDAVLVAFDLICINGLDLRREPIENRRGRLAALLDSATDGVQFSQAIDGDGDMIFRHACAMGLEGIVSKRLGSSYRSGGALIGRRSRTRRSSVPRTSLKR